MKPPAVLERKTRIPERKNRKSVVPLEYLLLNTSKDAPIRARFGLISVKFVTDFAGFATSLAGKEFRSWNKTINLLENEVPSGQFLRAFDGPETKNKCSTSFDSRREKKGTDSTKTNLIFDYSSKSVFMWIRLDYI